eukprot:TRINITY_DN50768_c0_g1_i1.p1 TRINITY_DN50768_c0_g1~~TRINITY_DN50768_c0_g1_i1.p1  ORF type:complete len:276 (+),score=5.34 TRINITY_DN50768_c0_g1_i1:63-830(+)
MACGTIETCELATPNGGSELSRDRNAGVVRASLNSYGSGTRYWDAQYVKHTRPLDWLCGYSDLAPFLEQVTQGDLSCSILHVGCGNSILPEEMYDAGYHNIANIDSSSVVIGQMIARNKDRKQMTWACMDATATTYEDCSFDVVLDKSLIDTLLCSPSAYRAELVARYIVEVARVLRPGGALLCISFGTPDARRRYFECADLTPLTVHELPAKGEGRTPHYVFTCRKCANIARSLQHLGQQQVHKLPGEWLDQMD